MSNIRLRYAGLINFLAQISRLATGLLFAILITRNLSVIEFGIWNIIGSLLVIGIFPASILGYWFFRYTARDVHIAKTGVAVTSLFSIFGIVIFFIAANFFVAEFEKLMPIFLFAAIQIPTSSLISSLSEISRAKKPEIVGYSLFIFEISKVSIAALAVYLFDLTLLEAIIVIILAQIIHVITLAVFTRDELKKLVEFENIKRILRTLWLPIYAHSWNLLHNSDILIVSLFTSSFPLIAAFKVVFIFSTILEHGRQLVIPLGTQLLRGGKESHVLITTKLMLTFTIPLAIGIFILAKPLLFMLNPEYASSEIILQIVLIYSFTIVISTIFETILGGTERVDFNPKAKSSDLLKSNLFKVPSLNLIRTIAYLVALTILILYSTTQEMHIIEIGIIWAIIMLATNIPIMFIKIKWSLKRMDFIVPWRNIGKYCISGGIMAVVLIFIRDLLTYDTKVTVFVPQLLGIALISILVYFGILLSIDSETRKLLKRSFSLMKS